jgi:uncharacterized membrane protein
MKRLYSEKYRRAGIVDTSIEIEDQSGAYLFKVAGPVWLVHPRPNTALDHFWERAFPRAESYSRVIQKVTRLAKIKRNSEREYEVLEEGSFHV